MKHLMGAAVFAVNEETNQIRGAPVEHSCTNFGKEYGRRHQPFEIRHGPEVETTAARRFTDWACWNTSRRAEFCLQDSNPNHVRRLALFALSFQACRIVTSRNNLHVAVFAAHPAYVAAAGTFGLSVSRLAGGMA
jgi:hypothetical protein